MVCRNCGKEVEGRSGICMDCGEPVNEYFNKAYDQQGKPNNMQNVVKWILGGVLVLSLIYLFSVVMLFFV